VRRRTLQRKKGLGAGAEGSTGVTVDTSTAIVGDCQLDLGSPSFNDRNGIFDLRHGTYSEHHRAFRRMLLAIEKST
jgi:hypothetical protein